MNRLLLVLLLFVLFAVVQPAEALNCSPGKNYRDSIAEEVTNLRDSSRVLNNKFKSASRERDSLKRELGVKTISFDSLSKIVPRISEYKNIYKKIRKVNVLEKLGISGFMELTDTLSLTDEEKSKLEAWLDTLPFIEYFLEYFIYQIHEEEPKRGYLERGEAVDRMGFSRGRWLGFTYLNFKDSTRYSAMVFEPVELHGRIYQLLIPDICGNPTIRMICKSERVEVPVPVFQFREIVKHDTVKIETFKIREKVIHDTLIIGQGIRLLAAIWGLYDHPFPNRPYSVWRNTCVGGEFALLVARKKGGFSRPHLGLSLLANSWHFKAATDDDFVDCIGWGGSFGLGIKTVFPSKTRVITFSLYVGRQYDWMRDTRPRGTGFEAEQYTFPVLMEGFTMTEIGNSVDFEYALYGSQGLNGHKKEIFADSVIGDYLPYSKFSAGHAIKVFFAKSRIRMVEFGDGIERPMAQDNLVNPGFIVQHNALWPDWSGASSKKGLYMVNSIALGPGIRFPRIALNLYSQAKYTFGYEDQRADGWSWILLQLEIGFRW